MYQFSVCFCKEIQYIFTFLDFEMNKEINLKSDTWEQKVHTLLLIRSKAKGYNTNAIFIPHTCHDKFGNI